MEEYNDYMNVIKEDNEYLIVIGEHTICNDSTIVREGNANSKVMSKENDYLQVIYNDRAIAYEGNDNPKVMVEGNDYLHVFYDAQAIAHEGRGTLKLLGVNSDSQNVLNAGNEYQVISDGDYTELTDDYEDQCTTATKNQELFMVIY